MEIRKFDSSRFNVKNKTLVLDAKSLGFEGRKWLFWQIKRNPDMFDVTNSDDFKTFYIIKNEN